MSLAPSLSVTLGDLRYDTHALELDACLAWLPRGGSASVTLPAGVRFEAEAGDDATLEADGGEGPRTLLTGKVRAVRRDFRGVRVTLADAAADLAAYRPCQTFERQNAGQVIRALVSGAGATAGVVAVDLDLPSYVAHPGRTAAEHVAGLARLGGAIALTDADGRVQVPARPSGQPTSALLYGRELLEYASAASPVPNPQRFAIGFGPSGSASAPEATRQTLGFLPSSAPAGGPGVVRQPTPVLRTPTAASGASTALQAAAAARGRRLWARCFLLPALRPGDVIEVQSLPDGLVGGPWLLTRVVHRLEPGARGSTVLEAEDAGASSRLSGLLGGALAALGGL
jgi:hypothetical protein